MMRMDPSCTTTKERKSVQNASSKVSLVVHKMLVPLLDVPMKSHISFDMEEDEPERELMDHMQRKNPGIMHDKGSFLDFLGRMFDVYQKVPTNDDL